MQHGYSRNETKQYTNWVEKWACWVSHQNKSLKPNNSKTCKTRLCDQMPNAARTEFQFQFICCNQFEMCKQSNKIYCFFRIRKIEQKLVVEEETVLAEMTQLNYFHTRKVGNWHLQSSLDIRSQDFLIALTFKNQPKSAYGSNVPDRSYRCWCWCCLTMPVLNRHFPSCFAASFPSSSSPTFLASFSTGAQKQRMISERRRLVIRVFE